MAKLIGIAGAARSGKDTIADYLVQTYAFDKLAFAHPVKRMLEAGFGLTHNELYGEAKDQPLDRLDLKQTPRELMQSLSTDWAWPLSGEGEDTIWLRLMEHHWNTRQRDLVIPDVRTPEEADWVRRHGELWHVSRHGKEPINQHVLEEKIIPANGDLHFFNVSEVGLLMQVRSYLQGYSTKQFWDEADDSVQLLWVCASCSKVAFGLFATPMNGAPVGEWMIAPLRGRELPGGTYPACPHCNAEMYANDRYLRPYVRKRDR